jgi:glyoxylase-like metal-dependent hydrolase (beta-lactamase superfamily II)
MSTVKSYSVGNGDMFYINHNSDSFTIIDCCLADDNKEVILKDIKKAQAGKGITRFISTHPDDDHLLGLKHLDNELGLVNFYCVKNEIIKEDETEDFKHYCTLRDSDKAFFIHRGITRKWLNDDDDKRGSAGIGVLWPIVTNSEYQKALERAEYGESPNNVSAVLGPVLSYR